MNILSPSILSADCAILGAQLQEIKQAGAKYVHVDVMDGMFVPSLSFGVAQVASLRKASDLVFDVHLMIEEPVRYVQAFAEAGADIITVHLEACRDVKATLKAIREKGRKAGLSIKPKTPVEAVRPYLQDMDLLLMMSVEPGFGGQKYIPESTERIRAAKALIEAENPRVDLEVDGGVTLDNVRMVVEAGANVLVAGSAVFKGNVKENTEKFVELIRG